MRKKIYKSVIICLLVLPGLSACNRHADTDQGQETNSREDSLKNAADTPLGASGLSKQELDTLANWLSSSVLKEDMEFIRPKERLFSVEKYDLNEDGKPEYFIALLSDYFCGSAGCTYYILNHDGSVNSRFTVSNGPFLILSTRSKGWHNLVINSTDGPHMLEFDGHTYPENPDVIPDLQKEQALNGTTIEGTVLEQGLETFSY